jgi:hypothetical protein
MHASLLLLLLIRAANLLQLRQGSHSSSDSSGSSSSEESDGDKVPPAPHKNIFSDSESEDNDGPSRRHITRVPLASVKPTTNERTVPTAASCPKRLCRYKKPPEECKDSAVMFRSTKSTVASCHPKPCCLLEPTRSPLTLLLPLLARLLRARKLPHSPNARILLL